MSTNRFNPTFASRILQEFVRNIQGRNELPVKEEIPYQH